MGMQPRSPGDRWTLNHLQYLAQNVACSWQAINLWIKDKQADLSRLGRSLTSAVQVIKGQLKDLGMRQVLKC